MTQVYRCVVSIVYLLPVFGRNGSQYVTSLELA